MQEKFRHPERISHKAEVITDPESQTVQDFHEFLCKHFKQEEVEPVDVFRRELASNSNSDANARYLCTALRGEKNNLISAAYGSVQGGVLAIRFTLTEISDRGTGVSQKADALLVDEAEKFCTAKGLDLRAYVGEAVDRSESYWNNMEIESGNGMRRLYATGSEIHYEIPPLAWNSDGTPAQDGIDEHLQVAVKGCSERVPVEVLQQILKDWWSQWYIRPRDQFESDAAWYDHQRVVWDILEIKILAPIRGAGELVLMSKKVREASRQVS